MSGRAGGGAFVSVLIALAWGASCKSSSVPSSGTQAGDDASVEAGNDAGAFGYPPDAAHVSWFDEVFSDVTAVAAAHQPDLALPFSGGIGVAVGDIDGDGRPDLVAPTGLGPTYVYENLGGWRFKDVTVASGVDGRNVANGATLCDVDGDGDLDLFLSTDEPRSDSNVFFFRNAGDGTFSDETTVAGIAAHGSVTTVLCSDLDGDGLLDLYVSDYAFIGEPGFPGRQDAFYRNRGDGTFLDVAPQLGLDADGLSWTAAAFDYDGDGDLDLYVGNDTFVEDDGTRPLAAAPDVPGTDAQAPADGLYRNDGPGTDGLPVFTNVTAAAGTVIGMPRGTMGIVAADLTGDGTPDWLFSNYGRKALAAGAGDGSFLDRTSDFGLEAIRRYEGPDGTCGPGYSAAECLLVSWGSALTDVDLDGNRDLVVLNGSLHGEQQPQAVWRGAGFDAGPSAAYVPVQTDLPWMVSRALVTADLDGDGDADLVLTNWRGATRLFQNQASTPGSSSSHWLAVHLVGTTSAPEGRGAVVTAGGVSQTIGVGGILDSSAPAEARFGLGGASTTSIDVLWPSGFATHVASTAADQIVTLTEPAQLTVAPRVIKADGASTASVVVKPAKPDGSARGPGATVTIDASLGTWAGPVDDQGDGTYTRTLVAASAPGLSVIRVTVDGARITVYPRVEFR